MVQVIVINPIKIVIAKNEIAFPELNKELHEL